MQLLSTLTPTAVCLSQPGPWVDGRRLGLRGGDDHPGHEAIPF